MSHQPRDRSFWFRGNAQALGGHVTSPISETVEPQATAVLPASGGFASTSAGKFNHRNIVSFRHAASTVAGRVGEHDGRTSRDTLVTVAIEGLNVLDVVTADRIVARLASSHEDGDPEPPVLPLGSHFENLRIGGVPIEAVLCRELMRDGRYGELSRSCAKRFVDAAGQPVSIADRDALRAGTWERPGASPVFEDRLLLAPLFDVGSDELPWKGEGSPAGPLSIHVPSFGTIYIGEYLVSRYARRLTMLRIELGCPVAGTLVAGDTDINGHTYP
jgi:hypothetical protein